MALLAAALAAGPLTPAATPATASVPPSGTASTSASGAAAFLPADDGAQIVRETRVDDRTLDLEIDSPALGRRATVRVLLPTGWAGQPGRTWPTLWLLHGCCEPADYRAWTQFTDVEEFTADKETMVVMPSGGAAGMYSAWWNFGLSTKPDWETFHVTETRQLLERNYRAGTRRSVAGLSIGGFGAMHYAFRHPELFGAAASYSGMLNTLSFGVPALIKTILVREGIWNWTALWGEELLTNKLWRSHNPYDNIEPLRGKALYVSSGNGQPSDLAPQESADALEPAALGTSKQFVEKLRANGVAVTDDFYGKGTHDWPYWERALHRSWPTLAEGLGL
ncbi:alpha/beta hydrolase family protein [Streptomyces ziwulingensis]|uniref:alpha/beta hydrolase n=1 Tax=Streptomyces ziwulingensis TaxID=1045501 RepID=UPI0031E68142